MGSVILVVIRRGPDAAQRQKANAGGDAGEDEESTIALMDRDEHSEDHERPPSEEVQLRAMR